MTTSSPTHPIQEHRTARGWSRHRLARHAGITEMTIYRAEHGMTAPSLETLTKLAGALGVDVDDLTPTAHVANLPEGDGHTPHHP